MKTVPKRVDGRKPQRRMTLDGWITKSFADERIEWDELWMAFAAMTAKRSKCVRNQVGSVLVSFDNRVLSIGYNGPPRAMPSSGPCTNWCDRARCASLDELDPAYADCPSIHSEANCLLLAPRDDRPLSTLYVSSAMCMQCAKYVVNASITRVVMRVEPRHRYRKPETAIDFMLRCGIEVVVWNVNPGGYRRVFQDAYGRGPHPCYFCHGVMPWPEVIHHVNGDHYDNVESNLAPAHAGCHTAYHVSLDPMAQSRSEQTRVSVTAKWTRRKPLLRCATCGSEMTPGWLERHCVTHGHDDGGQLEKWRQGQLDDVARRRVCDVCSREFETARGLAKHKRVHA